MTLPTFVGKGAKAEGLGAVTPPLPAAAVAGHGLILVGEGTTTAGVAADTGWVEVANGDTGGETRLIVWQRRMEAGDSAPTVPDLGDHAVVFIAAFSGIRETGDWLDAISTVRVQDTNTTTLRINGSTTSGDDRLILLISAHAAQTGLTSGYVNSDLANLTTRGEEGTSVGNTGAVVLGTGEKATAGAYGETTAGVLTTRFVSVSLAVLPAAGTDLVIQDASHAHSAESQSLTQVHELAVAEASHGHAADQQALTQVHELAVQESGHAHTADGLSLAQVHNLITADGLHAHGADNVTLAPEGELEVAGATHGHSADALALTQVHELAIQDASHGHSAESLVLSQVHVLGIEDAAHGLTSDELDLGQLHIITVADSAHPHTADEVAISGFAPVNRRSGTPTPRRELVGVSRRQTVATPRRS